MEYLPDRYLNYDVDPTSSMVLAIAILFGLVSVLLYQIKLLFSRPPPVPLKRLPPRPALSIQFKPDDIASAAGINSGIDNQTVISGATAAARIICTFDNKDSRTIHTGTVNTSRDEDA